MALFTKQRRPKGLTRKPVYWDPKKEERDARQKRINADLGITSEDKDRADVYRPDIKGKFRGQSLGNSEDIKQTKRKNFRRMFMFMLVLVTLLYLVLTAIPFLEKFLEQFL